MADKEKLKLKVAELKEDEFPRMFELFHEAIDFEVPALEEESPVLEPVFLSEPQDDSEGPSNAESVEQSEHATLEETKGENQENEMENPYEKYRLEAEQKKQQKLDQKIKRQITGGLSSAKKGGCKQQ